MRGTLSQRPRTPIRAELRLLIGVLVLGATLCACDSAVPPPAKPDAAHLEPTEMPIAEFRWPQDPSHPVLEIHVESAGLSGAIRVEMMPELAPATVIDVVELAEEGFYDGTTFHRVIPDFMIQGGDPRSRDRDPTNDGTGHAGRAMKDEFSRAPFLRGVVGMGNKGRENSTSSQFFIMHADNRNLDGRYNAVGRVLEGMDLVDRITRVEIDRSGRWGPKDRPIENVVMTHVRPIGPLAALSREEPTQGLEPRAGSLALAQPAEYGDQANPLEGEDRSAAAGSP